ncbi:MAG: tyrosine-type recombinase/integrase [Bacteroidota bacterium]
MRTKNRMEAYKKYLSEIKPEVKKPKSLSLTDAQDQYLDYVKTNFSPKTVSIYQNVFKLFDSFIGEMDLHDISTRDVDMYKASRIKDVSANTVNHDLRSLKAFFNRLLVWKMIESNPCNGIKTIRVVDTIRPYLSKEDLTKLLAYTKGTQLHDIILLAAMTGLRRGELLGLAWEDVDLKQGTLLVHSTIGHTTKGGKIRLIPMNSAVRELFERLPKNEGPIFIGERGGWKKGDFVGRSFKKAIRGCGLDPKLHFHSLRHTFASLLVKEGVSLYHVQRLLGHSSSRVTEIYAHLGTTELSGSVEKLAMAG